MGFSPRKKEALERLGLSRIEIERLEKETSRKREVLEREKVEFKALGLDEESGTQAKELDPTLFQEISDTSLPTLPARSYPAWYLGKQLAPKAIGQSFVQGMMQTLKDLGGRR